MTPLRTERVPSTKTAKTQQHLPHNTPPPPPHSTNRIKGNKIRPFKANQHIPPRPTVHPFTALPPPRRLGSQDNLQPIRPAQAVCFGCTRREEDNSEQIRKSKLMTRAVDDNTLRHQIKECGLPPLIVQEHLQQVGIPVELGHVRSPLLQHGQALTEEPLDLHPRYSSTAHTAHTAQKQQSAQAGVARRGEGRQESNEHTKKVSACRAPCDANKQNRAHASKKNTLVLLLNFTPSKARSLSPLPSPHPRRPSPGGSRSSSAPRSGPCPEGPR